MLRGLYERVMRLSASPRAPVALAALAFAESSFFPIPPDTLLAPMVLARREAAWRYAAICTLGSILGGLLGYAIGFSLEPVGRWLLAISGHPGGEMALRAAFHRWGVGVILLQGLLPVPYKLVTITCGLARFPLWQMIAASCVTRSVRFFGVTWLVRRYGPALLPVIERRLALAAGAVAAVLVLAFLGLRLLPSA
ncbi:MAG TPA: VTT domain-containing protein [Caulobacteraceae bacterium]|nr:VTT domain-containing protein [Caulobacteraceae bacterium]